MNEQDQAIERLVKAVTLDENKHRAERLILEYLSNYHLTLAWDSMEDHVKEITGKPMTLEVYKHINFEIGWSGFDNDISNFISYEHDEGRI